MLFDHSYDIELKLEVNLASALRKSIPTVRGGQTRDRTAQGWGRLNVIPYDVISTSSWKWEVNLASALMKSIPRVRGGSRHGTIGLGRGAKCYLITPFSAGEINTHSTGAEYNRVLLGAGWGQALYESMPAVLGFRADFNSSCLCYGQAVDSRESRVVRSMKITPANP